MKTFAALVLLVTVAVASPVGAEPPEQSGPYVFRHGDVYGLFFADSYEGLSMTIGVDPVEFCAGNTNFDFVRVQDITVPEDATRINRTVTGLDLRAAIWPFTAPDCALFTTVQPVGEGTVDVKHTDNDVTVFLNPDNYNYNTYGFRAHGLFGAGHPVLGRQNCLWDGNDVGTIRCVTKIAIKE